MPQLTYQLLILCNINHFVDVHCFQCEFRQLFRGIERIIRNRVKFKFAELKCGQDKGCVNHEIITSFPGKRSVVPHNDCVNLAIVSGTRFYLAVAVGPGESVLRAVVTTGCKYDFILIDHKEINI